ncbi:hypothetical protein A2282_02045 [candidate division WOR-1 bacterium RIFOXYA12_FULL_36_13]|nr:MAG: hypothetical protein A2282_02045 [candidate division WOR-1 bacterium RIFOXYA12_FULL_36_13]
MKYYKKGLLALLFFLCMGATSFPDKLVYFPDKQLEHAIRKALDNYQGEITFSMTAKIEFLDADELGIKSLEGIQHLKNLKTLYLDGNQIKDVSLLSNLKGLLYVYLEGNPIQDYSPLQNVYPYLKGKDFEINMPQKKIVGFKADKIIEEIIKPEYNEFERVLAIHDYIILNSVCDWDSYRTNTIPPESYTSYGVLVLGVGVCSGYAEAAKLLLDVAGVENIIICGEADSPLGARDGHAWNMVKIDEEWFHLDATWDDVPSVPNERAQISYKAFLLDDFDISLLGNRDWKREGYPKSESKKFLYMRGIQDKYEVSSNAYYSYGNWTEFYKTNKEGYDQKYIDGGKVPSDKIWEIAFSSEFNKNKLLQRVMVINVGRAVYDYYAKGLVPVKLSLEKENTLLTVYPPENGYSPGLYWLFVSRYGFVDTKSNKPIKMLFEVE